MKFVNGKSFAFFLLCLGLNAHAADGIRLGDVQYGGTGCPGGTASVALSPDGSSLSILFDSYTVEAAGRRTIDRKNCNIAIPIHVPQGYSYSVVALDYRGFLGLPYGGRAQLSVNYFLAGQGQGVRTVKNFTAADNGEYLKTDRLGLESIVWTACGADTVLRSNTSLFAQTNSRGDQALATVDSVDVNAGIIYQLQWKRCR